MNKLSIDPGKTDPMHPRNASGLPANSPFINLNAIVLSIEWEITDDIMAKFMAEADGLKQKLKKSNGLYTFLQLHSSIGRYIRVKRGAAHPDSIKLLHSVHNGLLAVASTPGMTAEQKNKILSEEIHKYKRLRDRIITARRKELGISATDAAEAKLMKTAAVTAKADLPEPLALAVEEIRGYIKEEFELLKKQLKSLTKGS